MRMEKSPESSNRRPSREGGTSKLTPEKEVLLRKISGEHPGITQTALSKYLGVSQPTVSVWLRKIGLMRHPKGPPTSEVIQMQAQLIELFKQGVPYKEISERLSLGVSGPRINQLCQQLGLPRRRASYRPRQSSSVISTFFPPTSA